MIRYDVGLVACSRMKTPGGQTPLTLYRGAQFHTALRHAQQRCGVVFIVSAKYGFLNLDSRISWYDTYLGDMTAEERSAYLGILERTCPAPLLAASRVLSHLPAGYREAVVEAFPSLTPVIRAPYGNLPFIPLVKILAAEIEACEQDPEAICRR